MSIEKILTKKISFYKNLTNEQKEELWGLLSDYQKYVIFLKHQKRVGVGKDKITITEYGIKGEDLTKFKNLKQWDRANYKYQKEHGQTGLDDNYTLYLFGDWFRMIENKKLIYGEIFSVHGYIFDRVEERLQKFEQGLYPHTTKFWFKKTKDKRYRTLESNTKAYGKEGELEQFAKFRMKFAQEILYPKIKKFILKNYKNKTYRVVNKKETFDNFHQFLFSDSKALRNCKFTAFLDDFNKLKGDMRDLKSIEKKFTKYAKSYLMDSFNMTDKAEKN